MIPPPAKDTAIFTSRAAGPGRAGPGRAEPHDTTAPVDVDG